MPAADRNAQPARCSRQTSAAGASAAIGAPPGSSATIARPNTDGSNGMRAAPRSRRLGRGAASSATSACRSALDRPGARLPRPSKRASSTFSSTPSATGRTTASTTARSTAGAATGRATHDVHRDRPARALYRLNRDLGLARVHGDVACANGLAWSPDGRSFYFGESFRYALFAYRRAAVEHPLLRFLRSGPLAGADRTLASRGESA
jgi:SMP-30/Gluconolactonase/LRE-like region